MLVNVLLIITLIIFIVAAYAATKKSTSVKEADNDCQTISKQSDKDFYWESLLRMGFAEGMRFIETYHLYYLEDAFIQMHENEMYDSQFGDDKAVRYRQIADREDGDNRNHYSHNHVNYHKCEVRLAKRDKNAHKYDHLKEYN